jgi:hypothetical protein
LPAAAFSFFKKGRRQHALGLANLTSAYVRQKVWDIMDGTGTFMPFENLTHQTLTAELVQAYAECMRYVYCVFPGVQPLKYSSLITANK